MDARRHLDRPDRLTPAKLMDCQTNYYRGWGSPVGAMLAKHMEELALGIRWVKAETPEDYTARHEIAEQDVRKTGEAIEFEKGRGVLPRARSEVSPQAPTGGPRGWARGEEFRDSC
jgi:hypothetical protein